MTAEDRKAVYSRALGDLLRAGAGYVLFTDSEHGDNYAEVSAERGRVTAEVSHRRWPACKLPPLEPAALMRLDRLGFREAERNPQQSYDHWTIPRMAKNLESVFLEVYGCPSRFELTVSQGK